jgi:hypothetical protein
MLCTAANDPLEMSRRLLVVSERLPAVAKRHDWAALRELCVGVG